MLPYVIVIIAAIVLMIIIQSLDEKRQPKKITIVLFLLGFILTWPIANLGSFFETYSIDGNLFLCEFYNMWLRSGLNEEGIKFLILFIMTWFSKHLRTRYDAVVYAVAVSIGFATMENILYIFTDDNPIALSILRVAFCLVGHCTYAIIMGCFYGLSKKIMYQKKYIAGTFFLILSFSISMFVHTFANVMLKYLSGIVSLFIHGAMDWIVGSVFLCYILRHNSELKTIEKENDNTGKENVEKKQTNITKHKLSKTDVLIVLSSIIIYSALFTLYACLY